MSLTYDSPGGGNFVTPIRLTNNTIKTYPFRQDLTAVIYGEEYVQRPDHFVPLALSTPHPEITDAYLISESNPRSMGNGGLVKWTRNYATIPADRTEFATTNFSFPAYKTDSADATELRAAFSETCVAKVNFSYVKTADPATDLSFTARFQPEDDASNNCNFVASDSTPTRTVYAGYVTAGTYIQAAQTKVRRWKGDIWELQDMLVKAL